MSSDITQEETVVEESSFEDSSPDSGPELDLTDVITEEPVRRVTVLRVGMPSRCAVRDYERLLDELLNRPLLVDQAGLYVGFRLGFSFVTHSRQSPV